MQRAGILCIANIVWSPSSNATRTRSSRDQRNETACIELHENRKNKEYNGTVIRASIPYRMRKTLGLTVKDWRFTVWATVGGIRFEWNEKKIILCLVPSQLICEHEKATILHYRQIQMATLDSLSRSSILYLSLSFCWFLSLSLSLLTINTFRWNAKHHFCWMEAGIGTRLLFISS